MFLLARTSPLLEFAPCAAVIITLIGGITTLFAGTIGLVQNDFKSIIAYSTCSQLGYMTTICGLSSYNVGIFHLFNHAFFKALLFLTAGAVIHALANEQDIRKFGGLQRILIFSYTALLIGTYALVGAPFLTGFYSKDVILEVACARYSLSAHFGYLLTCFSVLTTSYYSFRLLFCCFSTNANKYTNLHKRSAIGTHDSDIIMGVVLAVLAVGSVYAGWFFKTMFLGLGTDFWNNSIFVRPGHVFMIEAEFLPQHIKHHPLILTLLGAVLAYYASSSWTQQSYKVAIIFKPAYLFLSQRWLYDKLLNEGIAYPACNLGFTFIKIFDKGLLEHLPIFGLGLPKMLKGLSLKLGYTQSGLIYHYATIMILTALCALAMLSLSNVILFIDSRIFVLMIVSLLAI